MTAGYDGTRALDLISSGDRIQELMALNDILQKRALSLTQNDAEAMLAARKKTLREQGRVEYGLEVTQELIRRLSESAFITQENFAQTVQEVYEAFHLIKNMTSDFTDDADIIEAIILGFETICGGSTELLLGKGAARIVENYRKQQLLSDFEAAEADKKEVETYWRTNF